MTEPKKHPITSLTCVVRFLIYFLILMLGIPVTPDMPLWFSFAFPCWGMRWDAFPLTYWPPGDLWHVSPLSLCWLWDSWCLGKSTDWCTPHSVPHLSFFLHQQTVVWWSLMIFSLQCGPCTKKSLLNPRWKQSSLMPSLSHSKGTHRGLPGMAHDNSTNDDDHKNSNRQ